MSNLYLIAHKCRGEPAFDIAVRMECPECPEGTDEGFCAECDNTGFWWIIPTSGHRAYPHWNCKIVPITHHIDGPGTCEIDFLVPPMPSGLPDHYRVGPAPRVDIRALLRSNRPQSPPVPSMQRRFL